MIFSFFLTYSLLAGSQTTGINTEALEILQARAEQTQSSAVYVKHRGDMMYSLDDTDASLNEAMSVTKSIVALGVGRMLTTGELASLETPVADFYPEWKQGRKQEITIRHLLEHTSGLQNHPMAHKEIYPSPDVVQLALAAELVSDPGAEHSYNNKATNLIAGVFLKATGVPMDEYIGTEILSEIGIVDWQWQTDSADNPYAMAGLQIKANDLLTIGELVLNEGKFDDQQIIDSEIMDTLLGRGEYDNAHPLLWFRQYEDQYFTIDDQVFDNLKDKELPDSFLQKLDTLRGRYENESELVRAFAQAFGANWQQVLSTHLENVTSAARSVSEGGVIAWYGSGYLGQYLVVVPEHNLVAVRMIRPFEGINETHGFGDFVPLVTQLVY